MAQIEPMTEADWPDVESIYRDGIATGNATLLNNVTVVSRQMSILIASQPLPPQRRMGYFWLYCFEDVAPRQHYVMESGIIYAPGVWIPIRIPPFSPNYLYRLDVSWNLAGFPWTATII